MTDHAHQFQDDDTAGNADSTPPKSENSEPDLKSLENEDSKGSYENNPAAETEEVKDLLGSGYKANKKSHRSWTFSKRKTAAGGGIIGTIIAVLFGFSVFQGPLQFIHTAKLMEQFHLSAQEDQSDDRFIRIARYLRYKGNGQAERTRLGTLGNKYADRIEVRFNKAGIKSAYTPVFGYADEYIIDQDKFDEGKYKDKNKSEIKKAFKDRYGLALEERSGKLFVNADDIGYFKHLAFIKDSMRTAGYSRISAAVLGRLMGKRAGVDWHPIKKIDKKVLRTAETRYTDWREKRTEEIEKGTKTTISTSADPTDDPHETEAQKQERANNANSTKGEADSSLNDGADAGEESSKGNDSALADYQDRLGGKIALGGASAAGVICLAKGLADNADGIKQKQVNLPLIRMGMESVALGSQTMNGTDMDSETLGFYSKLYNGKDKKGKTSSWIQAKSIQAELGHKNIGTEADNTLLTIGKGSPFEFMKEDPIRPVASAVCSGVGQVATIVISFIGGPISALVSTAAGVVLGPPVMDALAHWLAGKAIDPNASGAKFGNYINYGVKLAANDMAIASGGRKLSKDEADNVKTVERNYYEQDFKGQGLAYKLFNPYDARSSLSYLIDRSSPDPLQNINTAAASLFNFTKIPSAIAGLFTPKASAAGVDYDYHFDSYGFSKDELNDSRDKNPKQNAEAVVSILESSSGGDYIDKAKTCFGVDIGKDGDGNWGVTSQVGEIPTYKDIETSKCDESSDSWFRIRQFIADTETMESAACYEGDDQACTNIGFDSADANDSSSSQTASGELPTGSSKELAVKLKKYIDDKKIQCLNSGCPDIVKTANGTSIKGGSCFVNAMDPKILGMLLNLVQGGHTFILSAVCSDHPSNPSSLHHQGKAVDFNTIDGVFMGPNDVPWDAPKVKAGKKLDQDIASFMPKSTGFGQQLCHSPFDFLSGFNVFPDQCHHQHVEVGG
jgi:hypothetical protein